MSEKSELNRRIELEALITEREGMIACSYPNPTFDPKETWKEFAELASKMRALRDLEAPPYTPDDVARLVEALQAILVRVRGRRSFDANGLSRCAEAVEEIATAAHAPFKETL